MSAIATAWAWENGDMEKNAKFLLVFLADSADRYGRGSRLDQLLEDALAVCGIETRSVIDDHWKTLVDKGLVEREDDGYQLKLPTPPLRSGFHFD